MTEKWPWQLNLGDDDHDCYCLKVIITGKLFENKLTKKPQQKRQEKVKFKMSLLYIKKNTSNRTCHSIPGFLASLF